MHPFRNNCLSRQLSHSNVEVCLFFFFLVKVSLYSLVDQAATKSEIHLFLLALRTGATTSWHNLGSHSSGLCKEIIKVLGVQ